MGTVDVLLLEQCSGRWILRSRVLARDREFVGAHDALEAAASLSFDIAKHGRPTKVILREWRRRPTLLFTYGAEVAANATGF
jgi:hypothetical protein